MNNAQACPQRRTLIHRVMAASREMGWVVLGQLLAFAGGIATIKLLTNAMNTEEYGFLGLALSIAGLYNMFVFGPLGQSVLRFYSIAFECQSLVDYVASIKYLHLKAIQFIVLIIVVPTLVAGVIFDSHWLMMIVLATLYGVAAGIHASLLSLQTAMRNRKTVAMHQALFVWLSLFFTIMAMRLFGDNSVLALLGMIVGALLTVISEWLFLRNDKGLGGVWCSTCYQERPLDLGKDIFLYSQSFVYFSAFAAVSLYADRWVLQSLYGPDSVGIYVALFLIANAPVVLLMGVVNQLMVPVLFQKAGVVKDRIRQKNSLQLLHKVFLVTAAACLFMVVVTWLFASDIVRLLSNVHYAQYADVLWLIVLGLCVFNLGQVLVIKGLNAGRPKVYLVAKAVQAFVFVIAAYGLAIWYEIYGVAIALVISSIIYILLVMRCNQRVSGSNG